jgi:flavin reductase (DIM6/NTAB) family NADH-FMN oxidoreductase RutF/pimeloyl-ACP methyl ester carboxylesterase
MLHFRGFGGVRLAADAFGSPEDPPVLLLPAFGQTKETWRDAGQALADAGRYAICLDLRGHGDSDHAADGRYDLDAFAEDIKTVLAQLPARPVIIAASLGGQAAVAALGECEAQLASGLLLVGVTLWVSPETAAAIIARFQAQTGGFDTLDHARRGIVDLHPAEPEPRIGGVLHSMRQHTDGRYYWRWDPRLPGQFDIVGERARLEAAAARLTLPTLIIRGAENESVSRDAASRLAGLIPSAELAEIAEVGHLVSTEAADEFNAAVLEFLERRVPREPAVYQGGSDPRVLRDALGCFATGVTVVTVMGPGDRPLGLTANSFTSVSLDPPLILFCLAKSSGSLGAFEAADAFAVNILQIGQQAASSRFARRDGERFDGCDWEQWSTGSPILKDSLGSFDCLKHSWHDAGDHVVIIGAVQQAQFSAQRDPLLFFRGRYRRLHFA